MPRALDAEERNRLVSEAAWRVLAREGIGALTVRKVAAEAGLAPSSLRYTLPTQAGVRIRAYEMVAEHITARTARIPRDAPDWPARVLLELLPLDEQRTLEMEANVTLGTAAMTDQALHQTHRAVHGVLLALCEGVARRLGVPAEEVPTEARRLHALIDGLALHLIRQEADEDTTWAIRVLDTHLARLGTEHADHAADHVEHADRPATGENAPARD
ncbi:TetR/AcrR family transcriptional regulator (plasmid) [Streptomyces sp. BI20]|uniref:TetR/AcrR family transcriptional regulator n=1 Tax=Streptomyces sp. BI20 TaxID=3403460 RepID=UPI003C7881AD